MDNKIKQSATKIKNIYKDLTYFDQYGTSVLIFIILIILFFIVFGYYSIMSNIQPIKDNWIQHRCSPKILPFAGIINKPDGKTATEFAQENFTQCLQGMVMPISLQITSPFDKMAQGFLSIFAVFLTAIQKIRGLINKIREFLATIMKNIMNRIANVMVPLQKIIISIQDMLLKMAAFLRIGNYSLLAIYYFIKSIIAFIIRVIYVFYDLLV